MQTPVIAEEAVKRVSYVDPTGYPHIVDRQLSNRLKNIRGTVAGLLDNSNDTSRSFFISLADVLQNEYGVSKVILTVRRESRLLPHHSKIRRAGQDVLQRARGIRALSQQ